MKRVLLSLLLSVAVFASSTYPLAIHGTNWNQICDSKGSHNPGTITSVPPDNQLVWLPTVRPPGESWDNIYIWQHNPLVTGFRIVYYLRVKVANQQSYDNLNALEWEVQNVSAGHKFNMAWQARKRAAGVEYWTFNFAAQRWEDSGLRGPASDIQAGVATEFISFFETNTVGPHHVGLSVNGRFMTVDIQRSSVSTQEANYTNFAWQFDSENKAQTVTVVWGATLNTI
jgi:hypothetical protein